MIKEVDCRASKSRIDIFRPVKRSPRPQGCHRRGDAPVWRYPEGGTVEAVPVVGAPVTRIVTGPLADGAGIPVTPFRRPRFGRGRSRAGRRRNGWGRAFHETEAAETAEPAQPWGHEPGAARPFEGVARDLDEMASWLPVPIPAGSKPPDMRFRLPSRNRGRASRSGMEAVRYGCFNGNARAAYMESVVYRQRCAPRPRHAGRDCGWRSPCHRGHESLDPETGRRVRNRPVTRRKPADRSFPSGRPGCGRSAGRRSGERR